MFKHYLRFESIFLWAPQSFSTVLNLMEAFSIVFFELCILPGHKVAWEQSGVVFIILGLMKTEFLSVGYEFHGTALFRPLLQLHSEAFSIS